MRALQFCFNPGTNKSDLVFGNGILRDDWLTTVIHTSLLTDRRAVGSELPDYESDPHGYFGDALNGFSYGSLLWTLRREKITDQLLIRARNIALDACQWLVRDNHVAALDIGASRHAISGITLLVRAQKLSGEVRTEVVIDAA